MISIGNRSSEVEVGKTIIGDRDITSQKKEMFCLADLLAEQVFHFPKFFFSPEIKF